MNLRNLFRVSAVFLMIGGLVWLLAPQANAASLGYELDSYGAYILQQLGASTIAIAALLFLVSGMANSPARQAVVTVMIVQQALSGIVSLLAVLGGAVPAGAGWFGVVFNFGFALAFAYFRFIRQEASMTSELQS